MDSTNQRRLGRCTTISLSNRLGRKDRAFPSRKEFYRRKRRVISRGGRSVCGRGSGRRGELRLAKLSLAVSDSFLSNEGTGGKERGGKQGDKRVLGTPGFPPLVPPGIPRPVNSRRFPVFLLELHATSSRSNSLLRPPPPPSPLSLPLFLLFLLLLASIPLRFHSSCFCAPPCRLPCPSQAMRRLYEVTSGRVEANSENLDRGST